MLTMLTQNGIDAVSRGVASLTVKDGQEFHFPSFSSDLHNFFLTFPQTFLIFVKILVLQVGESDSPARELKALATPLALSLRIPEKRR